MDLGRTLEGRTAPAWVKWDKLQVLVALTRTATISAIVKC